MGKLVKKFRNFEIDYRVDSENHCIFNFKFDLRLQTATTAATTGVLGQITYQSIALDETYRMV